jgi:methyl-accepting chemotaxis protein
MPDRGRSQNYGISDNERARASWQASRPGCPLGNGTTPIMTTNPPGDRLDRIAEILERMGDRLEQLTQISERQADTASRQAENASRNADTVSRFVNIVAEQARTDRVMSETTAVLAQSNQEAIRDLIEEMRNR